MNPINRFSIYNVERVSDPRRLEISGCGDEGRAIHERDPRVRMETSAPPVLERKRSLGHSCRCLLPTDHRSQIIDHSLRHR